MEATIFLKVLLIIFARLLIAISQENDFVTQFLEFSLNHGDGNTFVIVLAIFQIFLVNIIGKGFPEYKFFVLVRESIIRHLQKSVENSQR